MYIQFLFLKIISFQQQHEVGFHGGSDVVHTLFGTPQISETKVTMVENLGSKLV
jgi:hypothetical protein